MPTTIVIDGVTLTLKKYPEFPANTPISTDITLFANPVSGDLFKTTLADLAASIAGTTADNGLVIDPAGNVRLGGTVGTPAPLIRDTYIDDAGFDFIIQNSTGSRVLQAINSGTGVGLYGQAVSNVAVSGFSVTNTGLLGVSGGSGFGVNAQSANSYGMYARSQPASTNTVFGTALFERYTQGTAANGIGNSIDISNQTVAGVEISNQIISIWIDATDATRTSQFVLRGVLSASIVDVFTGNSDGSWQIRPITATAASAITPAEGMMLFVSTTDATFTTIGFWGYQNGAWSAF